MGVQSGSGRQPAMVSRAGQGAGVGGARCAGASALNHRHHLALADGVAFGHAQLLQRAGSGCVDGDLHLHGLDDEQRVALGHHIARLALQLPDGAGDQRFDGVQAMSVSLAVGSKTLTVSAAGGCQPQGKHGRRAGRGCAGWALL